MRRRRWTFRRSPLRRSTATGICCFRRSSPLRRSLPLRRSTVTTSGGKAPKTSEFSATWPAGVFAELFTRGRFFAGLFFVRVVPDVLLTLFLPQHWYSPAQGITQPPEMVHKCHRGVEPATEYWQQGGHTGYWQLGRHTGRSIPGVGDLQVFPPRF